MRKILKTITAGIFIAIHCNTLAQVGGIDGIAKGEVKDVNFNKDFAVDLYTGTVNINIPLEKIQQGSLPLDLGLSYDATGVLVNNISGIVGQNWHLNAGGSITRKIKGMCFDELNYDKGGQPGLSSAMTYQTGFFEARILLNRNDWKDLAHMQRILTRAIAIAPIGPFYGGPPYYEIDFGDGLPDFDKVFKIDTEPDIFYFNFFDKSGYFFMGEDGNWKVSSKDNLKVLYNEETDLVNPLSGIKFKSPAVEISESYKRKSIGRLTLVDDKGVKYIFGDNDLKSMEVVMGEYYTTEFFYPFVAKWNLKKVIDPNGKILYDFTYKTGQHFLSNLFVEARHEVSSNEDNGTYTYSANPQTWSNFYKLYRESGDLYKPSYLSRIVAFDGTSVDFAYVEKANIQYTRSGNVFFEQKPYPDSPYYPLFNRKWLHEKLNTIYSDEIPATDGTDQKSIRYVLSEVKVNFNNKLINKFNFQYANADPRVFLYQIIKNDDEKHQFFYHYPNDLPGYFSEKKDMWGYYNGYSTSLSHSNNYNFWQNFENNKYSTRGTVTSKMLNGSLQQIVWPTGGSTNFVFEPHSFRHRVINQKSLNNSVITETFPNGGGGLRIKKIISEGKEREFFYNNSFDEMDNNISSGILLYEPIFFLRHPVYELNFGDVTGTMIPSGGTSSADGINPKSDFFKSNVAYSTVFEKTNDGYIKYTFNDFFDSPDYYMEERMRPFNKLSKKIDMSFDRGQLKTKTYFDANQNMILFKSYAYKKLFGGLSSKGIDYNYFTSNYSEHPQDDVFGGGLFPISQPDCLGCNSKMDPYLIYYSDKVLETELTTEYFKDGRKIESLKRYYYKSPLDASYSLIDKIEEYPSKYDLSKFKTIRFDYAIDTDTSEPIIQSMIEKNMVGIPLAVTQYNEQNEPISRTETIYAKNSITNNLVLPVSTRTSKTGTYGYGNDAAVHRQVTYDLYDAHGRILQYTDGSGIPTTIIWGYNRSQPIAKITGATYNQVEANVNIGYLQDASDVDIDVASENILISLLDDLRKNMAFKDHHITTYTYDPLVGITTLTDPDGLREHYKYNTKNKLEKIMNSEGKVLEEYQYHYKN
ncbi:hypothetical protein [Chryseobacterium defluvii]|uniref:YD repeat-containing protein n=1 Tax=Chryseobacterium defluvii TaxID=160396 RepID=A0A495SPN9_9FLAO|nr:hypothetical protein [Chryseobacterium defluvii]RKT01462.1 hypothetical protein BCF58_0683 [Chryseobacterium defluvii]